MKEPYFTNPGISRSALMEFKKSPAHYYYKYIINQDVNIETDALIFGRAFHCKLLESEKFHEQYIICPKFDKRTTAGKQAYQFFITQNIDKIVLEEVNYNQIIGMSNQLLKKQLAQYIFNQNPQCEYEIYWIDEETKLECKAKLDMMIPPNDKFPNGLVIDLKSTLDANPATFINSVYKYGYYNQVAWYCTAFKYEFNLNELPDFLFINVEKAAPYESSFLDGYSATEADQSILLYGLLENRYYLQQLAECISNNNYPGYPDMALPMGLAEWQKNSINIIRRH